MTASRPQVSVIVPTYNCSGPLRLTLQTVAMQDLEDFEVWVIGDGCTDGSSDVVASLGDCRFRWVNREENSGGPSRPRNEALRRASGEYIAYLGHDDLWFPWHLSSLTSHIGATGASLACSLGALIAPCGAYASFSLPAGGRPTERTAISPSNWMHGQDLTGRIGLWSTRLRTGDDREFLGRVRTAGLLVSTSRQLSVLKFPAGAWRMYALRRDYPQTTYVEAMRDDPQALRDRVLVDLALSFAQRGSANTARSEALSAFRQLASRVVLLYGRTRWPVDWILYRRWRRRAGL